jgi:hypothetical protein
MFLLKSKRRRAMKLQRMQHLVPNLPHQQQKLLYELPFQLLSQQLPHPHPRQNPKTTTSV